jgi:predicted Rossmann fold flavoprotein
LYHKIIVIGGGASGLTASIIAKNMGQDIAILEGSDRIGKKILSTGNGRCNISNTNITDNRYHSRNTGFMKYVLENFSVQKTVEFFNSLGLPITTLEEGKMFPLSLQASSVLDILMLSINEKKIPIYLNSKIREIKLNKNKFQLYATDGNVFECSKLIIASGGKSLPATGSDGSGFSLAKAMGHKIISPLPSLVQLKLNFNHLKALSGIKFMASAEIIVEGISRRKEYGEILFTDYGISGPPILQLSREASIALNLNKKTEIKIDMFPDMSNDELKYFVENHIGIFGYRSICDVFIGIINKKMIPVLLKAAGILNIHNCGNELNWNDINNICTLLKGWTFEVIDTNPFKNSQVTCGGIDTKFVYPDTLESKIVPNLFFCGEVLDVDGDCGGYNLQWAWSSGYTAGTSASN